MKAVLFAIWLCVGGLPTIPAFAQNNQGQNQDGNNQGQNQGAPAPLIGFGVPAALAVGGVLLIAKLINRKR
jgi:hypothetical protein